MKISAYIILIIMLNLIVFSKNLIGFTDSTNQNNSQKDYIGNKAKFYVNTFIGLANPIADAGFEIVVDEFLPRLSFNYELSYLFGLDFFKLDNTANTSQFYGTGLSNRFSGGICILQWESLTGKRLLGAEPKNSSSNHERYESQKAINTGLGYDALKRLTLKFDFLISPAFGSSLEESECKCWRQGYDTYFVPKLRYETIGKSYNPHNIFDLGFIFNLDLDKYGWYFEYTNRHKSMENNFLFMRFQFGVLYYKNAKIFVENDGCCISRYSDLKLDDNLIKKPTNPTILLKLLFGVTI